MASGRDDLEGQTAAPGRSEPDWSYRHYRTMLLVEMALELAAIAGLLVITIVDSFR